MEMANQFERILESAKKGAAKSNRTEGKRERQEEMFPKLQEEIAKKRKELYEPMIWATPEARHSEAFKEALWKACQDKIGGPPEDRVKFFSETIARWPQCFWIDGCAAPMVKNYTIRFRMKPNAKPVARQPIPVSPYDDLRVEFHVEEAIAQGKLRMIEVADSAVCTAWR
jgi:hypothetical protein